MMRIQLHLEDRQDRQLRALARRQRASRAELIRRAIDRMLQEEQAPQDPLLSLVGAAGPAGRPDVSERHDEIVYSGRARVRR
jgi:Arc/MetJ-type ribon-helix-helix transcriptional regulator